MRERIFGVVGLACLFGLIEPAAFCAFSQLTIAEAIKSAAAYVIAGWFFIRF
jgi:hypothetical protein